MARPRLSGSTPKKRATALWLHFELIILSSLVAAFAPHRRTDNLGNSPPGASGGFVNTQLGLSLFATMPCASSLICASGKSHQASLALAGNNNAVVGRPAQRAQPPSVALRRGSRVSRQHRPICAVADDGTVANLSSAASQSADRPFVYDFKGFGSPGLVVRPPAKLAVNPKAKVWHKQQCAIFGCPYLIRGLQRRILKYHCLRCVSSLSSGNAPHRARLNKLQALARHGPGRAQPHHRHTDGAAGEAGP